MWKNTSQPQCLYHFSIATKLQDLLHTAQHFGGGLASSNQGIIGGFLQSELYVRGSPSTILGSLL